MTQPAAPPQHPAPAAAAPAAPAAAPAPAAPDPASLSVADQDALAARLAGLRAERAAAGETGDAVRMKVEPPHESLSHGGVTITNEFSTVQPGMVAAMVTAAADAGVKITQET